MRVLGIDLGRSRTGFALSDPLGVTCSPLEVVEEEDEGRLAVRIAAVAREQEVGQIVLGLPRPLGGHSNKQLQDVLSFKTRLERETTVPVLTWDERFTSKLAEKDRSRTHALDAVAACYILQSYLDSHTAHTGDS